jgi:hypothetical protein
MGGGWAPGARRPGLGRTGPDWAGFGWGRATSRIETHGTHNHQTEINRESKIETERDEHATPNKEMCFGMMQPP